MTDIPASAPAAEEPVRLPPDILGLGIMVLAMMGFATWDQWAIWSTKEDYTFGYLVPAFSLYVLWDRWPMLESLLSGRAPTGEDSPVWLRRLALALTLLCLVTFALGVAGRAVFGTGVVVTLAVAFGLMGTMLGFGFLSVSAPGGASPAGKARWQALGILIFPAAIWIVSGPFLYMVDNQVKGPLLSFVTEFVAGVLRVSGHEILVRGNIIVFANGQQVGIADACSGIRSLSACVFVGAFLGSLWVEGSYLGSMIRRALLIALAALAAIVLNVARNTYLSLYAGANGSAAIDRDFAGLEPGQEGFSFLGTVHDLAGNVAMAGAFLVLLACVPLVNRMGRVRE
jgi:exosortase/archaeosortase family protein